MTKTKVFQKPALPICVHELFFHNSGSNSSKPCQNKTPP